MVEQHRTLYKQLRSRCRRSCRSIGVGAVSTAEGSALVKIGSTTMIAGVKLEVMRPTLEAPDEGAFEVGLLDTLSKDYTYYHQHLQVYHNMVIVLQHKK